MIKKELKTFRGCLVFALCVLAMFFGMGLGATTSAKLTREGVREITLEIRNMAFAGNNPTIYVRPGETVRFAIYNYDKGMQHDFAIEGMDVKTRILQYGEKIFLDFQAPVSEGEYAYVCNLHALFMRGRLKVTSDIPPEMIMVFDGQRSRPAVSPEI